MLIKDWYNIKEVCCFSSINCFCFCLKTLASLGPLAEGKRYCSFKEGFSRTVKLYTNVKLNLNFVKDC